MSGCHWTADHGPQSLAPTPCDPSQTYRHAAMLHRNLDDLPDRLRQGALSIGNFDGVHRGHARIVQRLVEQAQRVGGPAMVFTFDPHPAQVLRPDAAPAPLGWTERKAELLAQLGVDAVVAFPTTTEFLAIEAEEFFRQVVIERFQARAVVEGPNFFFGRRRKGDIHVLAEYCQAAGIALDVVEPVAADGQVVSSSRIRELIEQGNVDAARKLLVQPHRIRGRVVHGAARGASLGYPTANVEPTGILVPGEGIYAARALADGNAWPAAVSVGPNPTFDEGARKIEAYLIGYAGDLYEQMLQVDFLARLRDIERFDSVAALVAQMARDVAASEEIAAQHQREEVRL